MCELNGNPKKPKSAHAATPTATAASTRTTHVLRPRAELRFPLAELDVAAPSSPRRCCRVEAALGAEGMDEPVAAAEAGKEVVSGTASVALRVPAKTLIRRHPRHCRRAHSKIVRRALGYVRVGEHLHEGGALREAVGAELERGGHVPQEAIAELKRVGEVRGGWRSSANDVSTGGRNEVEEETRSSRTPQSSGSRPPSPPDSRPPQRDADVVRLIRVLREDVGDDGLARDGGGAECNLDGGVEAEPEDAERQRSIHPPAQPQTHPIELERADADVIRDIVCAGAIAQGRAQSRVIAFRQALRRYHPQVRAAHVHQDVHDVSGDADIRAVPQIILMPPLRHGGGVTWKVSCTAEADSRASRTKHSREEEVEVAPGIGLPLSLGSGPTAPSASPTLGAVRDESVFWR
ncbi:hypothetical protein K438DRAFT_1774938 [Mycena galopus ATCC 62051]|nr:hypothetical protein K438DRAFT_1774938 [Mycena galopus ATCC 62051]